MKLRSTLFAALALLAPLAARAQGPAGWNDPRALELIMRAQERRSAAAADTGLVNFQADARLYVYFYLDRPDTGERNLVKTDQLALDVLWAAPNRVKQRIVGWRDEKSLPTNINYHLDHLTVVLENFGDEIRLGDGDEVRGVPHPAAGGSEAIYDYRLADSLTLQLPGTTEPLRVYELKVRPKDPDRPAFLGSVFVDRRAGDIVRMDFTFTRSSYIDRYLDYINISLDNGLWRGRFWLPNQQRVEIRRRIPVLDIPAGSIIRATMRVSNYRFNQPLPPSTFAGPRVVTVPRVQREAFPFEEELHAEVRAEGIGPSVELGAIRAEAAELVRAAALERAATVGVRIPAVSDVFRYNRAEGLVLSAGARLTPTLSPVRVAAQAGWAFGASHPLAALDLSAGVGGGMLSGSVYLNRPRDIGPLPVASGALNTLASFFAGEDYLDLYFTDGVRLGYDRSLAPLWSLGAETRLERQKSPELGSDFSLFGGDLRPVRAIDDSDATLVGALSLRRAGVAEAARWWSGELRAEGGSVLDADVACLPDVACVEPGEYLKPIAEATVGRRWLARESELRLRGAAGMAFGALPAQEVYLVGGRGTVAGYPFRAYGGDRFALADATLSAELARPWLRGRLTAAAGWAEFGDPEEQTVRATSGLLPMDGVKPSLGVGLGIFHDILQVDLVRGLASDGKWELVVEANPSFWDFL
jgi:hypothetical protein